MKKFSRSLRKSFHLKRSREEETSGASRDDEEREAGGDADAAAAGDDDDGRGKAKSAEGFMGTLRRRLSSRQKGRGKEGDRAAPAARGVVVAWDGDAASPAPPNGGHPARWSPASSASTGSRGDPAASPAFASPFEANGARDAARFAVLAPVGAAPAPGSPADGRRRDGPTDENAPTDAAPPFAEEAGGGLLGPGLGLPGSPTGNGLDCNDNPTRPRAPPAGPEPPGAFADGLKGDVEDMDEEDEEERSSPSSSAMLQSESDPEERAATPRGASRGSAPARTPDEDCDASAEGASIEDAAPADEREREEEERDSDADGVVEPMPPAAPSGASASALVAENPPRSTSVSAARPRLGSGGAAGRTACADGADYLNVNVHHHPDLNVNLFGDAAATGPGVRPSGEPLFAPEPAPCDGGRTRRRVAGPGADAASPLDTGAVPPGARRLYEGASRAAATSLTEELKKLARHGWYWGPVTRQEAEEKLAALPDGAFLVRDSSDERYLLSLSFRSRGRTLHTRIEHSNGRFSFYEQPELEGHASVVRLVESSVRDSEIGAFCYSRSRFPGSATYPVRLTAPVSRFMHVRSLQYLCRFVIRQSTRIDLIRSLPLPNKMKDYLQEKHY